MITTLPTDDQRMLADSARSYVQRQAGAAPRWQDFADFGWLALPLPTAWGGLGGSTADVCVLAEALGRAPTVAPFVALALLGAGLLAQTAGHASASASDGPGPGVAGSLAALGATDWPAALADGRRRVALAAWEPGRAQALDPQLCHATPVGGGWQLSGIKGLVLGGDEADACLVSASLGDGRAGLFLLAVGTPGLALHCCRLIDGQGAATLHLDGVAAPAPLLAAPVADLQAHLQHALDRATLAHGAELIGAMAQAFDTLQAYLQTRQQFGRAIASNQVVQHRLVDLHVAISEARAITTATAAMFEAAAPAARQRWCAATRAHVAQTAQQVWEEVVQLHGAIGMTADYPASHHIHRLAVGRMLYGDAHQHLERLAAATLDGMADQPPQP